MTVGKDPHDDMAAGLPGRAQYPRRGSIPRAMNYKTILEGITLTENTGIITATGRTREEITASVRIHMRSMVNNALEIGLDLIDMKDACQHGEWMPWLKEIGLSASTAANYMRIAREVSGDSKVAQLPYTKILALMAAPKEDREALAEAAESMSAAEIRKLTEERNKAAEAANAETMRADQAEKDAKMFNQEAANLRNKVSVLQNELNKQKQYASDLLKELETKGNAAPDQDREILLQAAAEAEQRAADAEAELETLKAGGAGQPEPVWKVLKVAMTRFMTDCEMMPLDPAAMAADKVRIEANLTRLEKWADMMRIALAGVVPGEGAVE